MLPDLLFRVKLHGQRALTVTWSVLCLVAYACSGLRSQFCSMQLQDPLGSEEVHGSGSLVSETAAARPAQMKRSGAPAAAAATATVQSRGGAFSGLTIEDTRDRARKMEQVRHSSLSSRCLRLSHRAQV